MDLKQFESVAATLGILLTQDQLMQFGEFESALYEANEVMNLTRVSREEAWLRHFIDSLLFHDLLPLNSRVLDIGTGPGFPAWPLACARPDLQVTAIDSSGKMIGFLSSKPLPNLTTLKVRAEEWGMREAFDVVTGRAVAPLAVQLELSAAPAKDQGLVIPMRTPAERSQLPASRAELGLELLDVHERALPGTDVVRLFPVYRKVGRTDKKYPRTWPEIRRKPLI